MTIIFHKFHDLSNPDVSAEIGLHFFPSIKKLGGHPLGGENVSTVVVVLNFSTSDNIFSTQKCFSDVSKLQLPLK